MKTLRSGNFIASVLTFIIGCDLVSLGWLRPNWIHEIWSPFTLFILLVTLAYWLNLLFINLQDLPIYKAEFWKKRVVGILICITLTLLVTIGIEPEYRVLSDETNLIAVSKSIALNHSIENVTMGKWYYHQFHSISGELPKRPPLFSFLLACIHIVLGYNPNHAFLLNSIVLFFLISLIYGVFNHFLNGQDSFFSILIVLGQPIITLCARCAGFDLLAVTCLIGNLYTFYNFILYPKDKKLKLIWISTILIAYTRYEYILISFIFHVILLAFVYFFWKSDKNFSWLYSITPILYAPLLWQQGLSQGSYAEGSEYLFHIKDFLPHLLELIKAQISLNSPALPYIKLANWIGCLSLLIWLLWLIRRLLFIKSINQLSKKLALIVTLLIGLLMTTILTGLYLSHYFGHYTHPASARFFLLFTITISLMPLFLKIFITFPSSWILWYATFIFLVGYPLAMKNSFFITLTEVRKDIYVQEFLSSLDSQDFLLITSRPGQYTIYDYGSINFDYANHHINDLENELSRGLYSEIFVVQNYEYSTDQVITSDQLNKNIDLQLVKKVQLTEQEYIQVSKIKEFVKPDL